jgi:hypothetical protein
MTSTNTLVTEGIANHASRIAAHEDHEEKAAAHAFATAVARSSASPATNTAPTPARRTTKNPVHP